MIEDERSANYDETCGGCVAGINPWHRHGVQQLPRPFRDLCSEADTRDAMDDGEFWEHVLVPVTGPQVVAIEDFVPLDEVSNQDTPCPVCGGYGACFYDFEGRALVHVAEDDDAIHF